MKLRTVLLGGVAALGLVGSAVAADLPVSGKAPVYASPPAGFSWTGVYIGIDAGYAFSAQDIGLSNIGDSALTTLQNPGSINGSGAIGGLHAGFLYQFAPLWVWGVEGRFAATGLKSSATDSLGNTLTTSLPWEGAVVGRLGILPEQKLMLYGLGGVAFGEIKQGATTVGSSLTPLPIDNIHAGWTAGLGVEYAFTNSLTAGIEYRYTNLGSQGIVICSGSVTSCSAGFNASTTAAWNEIVGRINIKF